MILSELIPVVDFTADATVDASVESESALTNNNATVTVEIQANVAHEKEGFVFRLYKQSSDDLRFQNSAGMDKAKNNTTEVNVFCEVIFAKGDWVIIQSSGTWI